MSQLNPTKRTLFEVDSLDNSSLLLAEFALSGLKEQNRPIAAGHTV